MSAWTKGPWEADLYRDGAFDIVAEKVMGGALVLASRSRHVTRADEMHANGRLIAAAPALVSALEKAQQRLAALRAYVPVHMQTVYSCDMDDIDSAIRLATGDQP